MNTVKKLLALFFSALILTQSAALASCKKEPEKFTEYSFDCFDTVTTVTGYADSREEFDKITADILAELREYHKLFTIYNRYENLENLCTVNELKNGEHRTVTVDRRIIDMLLFAKDMYALSKGKVNIAMGSVLSIWHEYRQDGTDDPFNAKLPPMEKLAEAAKHTDINNMVIDEENCTVTLTDPQMRLDVGAIAKGYAIEMVAQSLEARGIGGYIINVGGNVRTLGTKPDGSGWTVGVRNPDPEAADYIAYLSLVGESLVTSGSYQRYYTVNGKDYHHIIDTETLMPSQGFTSVSILCKSSALGDALSTALFCMSLEDGRELIDSLDGVEAMWVAEDGNKYYTDGFLSE